VKEEEEVPFGNQTLSGAGPSNEHTGQERLNPLTYTLIIIIIPPKKLLFCPSPQTIHPSTSKLGKETRNWKWKPETSKEQRWENSISKSFKLLKS